MKKEYKKILRIESMLPTIELDKIELCGSDHCSIIWNNDGRYRIISDGMILNEENVNSNGPFIFHWYDAIELDERVAKLLLDE